MNAAQHTIGHVPPCPGCLAHEVVLKTEIGKDLLYPVAAEQWIESRSFVAGAGRARYLREHSLHDLRDYNKPLKRFFGMLQLSQIRIGNLKQYQYERSSGLLGLSAGELLPVYLVRVARALKKTAAEVEADPQAMALVHAQLEAHPEREVSPNKINQELGMLIRILKCAGVWTADMEENYQPLQHEESDIARALTPDEQENWMRVAQARQPFVHWYSIVGIDCTLRTKEEREIKIGDVNLASRILLVRSRSTKNKYGIRTVPLSDSAVWAFEQMLEHAKDLGSTQPQHFLMPIMIARGHYDPMNPMSVSGIKKPWDEVRGDAGVPWFTPYGLRHTGCTRYAESGMSIHTLLSMAGHMSMRTQQHYVHVSEQAKKTAVQRAYSLPERAPSRSAGTSYRSPRGAAGR